ncbi:MAG: ATP-binding protein [Caldisericia bacterium]|nr:ATP-binding protein [Caldisericia bacterium]MDD4614579.1 ATP-binding protein [Caldisericia bacterium]
MNIDFQKITKDNLVGYGNKTEHLESFSELYSDHTHFIYEILQNAEDAGAEIIKFHLKKDRICIYHDGKTFNEQDVRAICSINRGTKKEEKDKIGKFGIGFKSVYAYTEEPLIYLEEVSFGIQKYIRPHRIPLQTFESIYTTLFVLPFKNSLSLGKCFEEIHHRLLNLGLTTLLFLRNLKKIEFIIDENESGFYSQSIQYENDLEYHTLLQQINMALVKEKWIVFSDKDNPSIEYPTQIAFQFSEETNDFEYTANSPIGVYFPTKVESHMGFLMNGPFNTTPTREQIKENDDHNENLVKQIAELLSNAILQCKAKKLLTPNLLLTLPLDIESEEKYDIVEWKPAYSESWFLYPIVDKVLLLFQKEAIIPCENQQYEKLSEVIIAQEPELLNLLSKNQCMEICNGRSKIIQVNIPPKLEIFLVNYFQIPTLVGEAFLESLSDSFMEDQSDVWLSKFYQYLYSIDKSQKDIKYLFQSKKWLRLDDQSMSTLIIEDGIPTIFLSASSNYNVPMVKKIFLKNAIVKSFFSEVLDLPILDSVELSKRNILDHFNENNLMDESQMVVFLESIQKVLREDSGQRKLAFTRKLCQIPWVPGINFRSGSKKMLLPHQVYILNSVTKNFFSGNPSTYYANNIVTQTIDTDILLELGFHIKPHVHKAKFDENGRAIIYNEKKNYIRSTSYFDPYIFIDGLHFALSNPTIENSKYIWNQLIPDHIDSIQGKLEYSAYKSFKKPRSEIMYSEEFGSYLQAFAWLPHKNEFGFFTPQEIRLKDLPIGFNRNEEIAEKLGMISMEDKQIMKELDLDDPKKAELVRKMKGLPVDKVDQILAYINDLSRESHFPQKQTSNSSVRKLHIQEEFSETEDIVTFKKHRSVRMNTYRIEAKEWLRDQYTNSDGKTICQMCEREMPFKTSPDEYYFEAVQVEDNLKKTHESLFLALCPLCAAKYRELLKRDETLLLQVIKAIQYSPEETIPMVLKNGERSSLRFTEKHLIDIQEVLSFNED